VITPIGHDAVQTRPTADTMDSYINLGGHADTPIPQRRAERMEWESCAVAAAAASRWGMSGKTRWDGCTDGGRGQSLMTVSCYTEMTRGVHSRFSCSHSLVS